MMMRFVFQDSAFSVEGRDGDELVQGRGREGERGRERERERGRGRERYEKTDLNASPNISLLLGTVWLSD